MAVNGIEIAVGQVWRDGRGEEVTIERPYGDTVFPWASTDGEIYSSKGRSFEGGGASDLDLVELISPQTVTDETHEAATFHALPVVDVPQMDVKSDPAQDKRVAHALAGIGDIASDAKGTGARYNAGKTPYFLTPLAQIGAGFLYCGGLTPAQENAARALQLIGDYQSRESGVEALYKAMSVLGMGGWRECARVFEYGKAKYKAWNWAKGMPWSVPIECTARHIVDGILAGEDVDPESNKPHRGHVFCNLVMLIAYAETYPEGDDRPEAGLLSRLPAANDVTEQVAA